VIIEIYAKVIKKIEKNSFDIFLYLPMSVRMRRIEA